MKNPFSIIKTDKDRIKGKLEKSIKDSAWNITKKFAIGSCRKSDIDELENYYKKYFKKYPNEVSEHNAIRRIAQLRSIIKG